jgi:sn-glycerol 3-phosphate transport system substrate-binding protein
MSRILLSSAAAVALLASAHGAARRPRSSGGTPCQATSAKPSPRSPTIQQVSDRIQGRRSLQGSYTETLTAAVAAFRAKQAPHIVQVFEVGTANMMAAKGAVYPCIS